MKIVQKTFLSVVLDSTSKFNKVPKSQYLEKGQFPIIDQGNEFIAGYTNNPDLVTIIDEPIVIFGDHTRALKYIDFPCAIGADGVKVLSVKPDETDPKYLYYVLRSLNIKSAGYSRHFKFLKEKRLPIPTSLNDQKRIAQVLSHAEGLVKKRKDSLALLDEFLKSTFLEMFGDPVRNEKAWKSVKMGKVVTDIVSGTSYPGQENKNLEEGELGVLKISAVTSGEFDENEFKAVSEVKITKKLVSVKKGMFLMSRANTRELVAACCIVPNDYPRLFLPDKLWSLEIDEAQANSTYLNFLFKNQNFRSLIAGKASGGHSSMLNISMKKFRNLSLPLPDSNLQTHFAEIVEKVEVLKSQFQESLLELENLYGSLSQKAFKGELQLDNLKIREFENADSAEVFVSDPSVEGKYLSAKDMDIIISDGDFKSIQDRFDALCDEVKDSGPLNDLANWFMESLGSLLAAGSLPIISPAAQPDPKGLMQLASELVGKTITKSKLAKFIKGLKKQGVAVAQLNQAKLGNKAQQNLQDLLQDAPDTEDHTKDQPVFRSTVSFKQAEEPPQPYMGDIPDPVEPTLEKVTAMITKIRAREYGPEQKAAFTAHKKAFKEYYDSIEPGSIEMWQGDERFTTTKMLELADHEAWYRLFVDADVKRLKEKGVAVPLRLFEAFRDKTADSGDLFYIHKDAIKHLTQGKARDQFYFYTTYIEAERILRLSLSPFEGSIKYQWNAWNATGFEGEVEDFYWASSHSLSITKITEGHRVAIDIIYPEESQKSLEQAGSQSQDYKEAERSRSPKPRIGTDGKPITQTLEDLLTGEYALTEEDRTKIIAAYPLEKYTQDDLINLAEIIKQAKDRNKLNKIAAELARDIVLGNPDENYKNALSAELRQSIDHPTGEGMESKWVSRLINSVRAKTEPFTFEQFGLMAKEHLGRAFTYDEVVALTFEWLKNEPKWLRQEFVEITNDDGKKSKRILLKANTTHETT